MKSLYINYKGVAPEGDATLSTEDDVDKVLDGIRDELNGAGALLMMIGFTDDPDTEGPLLQVGINGEKGLLTYDGPDDAEGLLSAGANVNGTVLYSFQSTKAEFPASAEVGFPLVKQAVKEFMMKDGALPPSVNWRPDVD